MKLLRVILFLPVFMIASGVSAQQHGPTSAADKAFASGDYYDAITLYKKAYTKEKNKLKKAEILFKVAESYRKVNDFKNQEQWYAKSIKGGNKDPKAVLYLADALKFNGKYPEAIVRYNEYKKAEPGDPKGDIGVQSSEQAQKWKDRPTRFKVENLTALNTKYADFAAMYSHKDKRHIIFTSSRSESTGKNNDGGTGEKFQDLFEATVDKKGKWSSPKPLPEQVNSNSNEGAATITAKGDEMYFTRCENEKGKIGLCDIYFTKRNGQTFDQPKLINLASDSTIVAQPTLTPDGKTLYFVSNMEGGEGGYDIWMATKEGKGDEWGNVKNLGSKINTAEDEMFPYAAPDGNLYFASKGHIGMGGLDIFKTKMNGSSWDEAVNMKYPVNSSADDFAFSMMDESGEKGFLSSNREGGKGNDDLYQWSLPPLVFTVSGRVYDSDTRANIPGAHVELFSSDGSNIPVNADKTGNYKFDLKPETDYKIVASAPSYLSKQFDLSTKGLEQSKDFVSDFDFAMKSTAKAIELPNILYDLGKWDLRPESKRVLDGLVQVLNDNPTVVIELGSHTDSRPIPMTNLVLSQKRAESVVQYLIEKGIPQERMTAKGYGETQPRVLDKDMGSFRKGDVLNEAFISKLRTNTQKEEAHQLNRRTEFRVLRTDYVKGANANPADTAGSSSTTPVQNEKLTVSPQQVSEVPPTIDAAPVKQEVTEKTTGEIYTVTKDDVRKGYTAIAKQFSTDVKTLKSLNGIKGEPLYEGMELKVTPGGDYTDYDKKFYTLEKDDNKWKIIAKKVGMKESDLKKLNKNLDEDNLRTGKKVRIEK